jgi:hypothetical protein
MISSALRPSCDREVEWVELCSRGVDTGSVELARGADDDASIRGTATTREASCCKDAEGGEGLGVHGMRPRDFNAAA